MAEKTNLEVLYDNLRANNYDVPETYASFERTLVAPGKEGTDNRLTLYRSLKEQDYDVPDTYESFANTLFAPGSRGQAGRPHGNTVVSQATSPSLSRRSTQPAQPVHAASATSTMRRQVPSSRPSVKGKTDRHYTLRRGGVNFQVSEADVKKAGGFEAYEKSLGDGAGLRVWMMDRAGKRHHVAASAVRKYAQQGWYAVAGAPKGSWHPTEREKVSANYKRDLSVAKTIGQLNRSEGNTRRVQESMTQTGRNKKKAAEFEARSAGLNPELKGYVGAAPGLSSSETSGADAGNKKTLPMNAPTAHGVKMSGGKPVIEWQMPDGSLTTDRQEAEHGAYQARKGRLQHEFVNRMKQNGLDPAKQEDVQRQAELDMISTIVSPMEREGIAESLWQEAEEKHKADRNANADKAWSSYAAMGGGREMRVVTASMNRHADKVSHMTRFDLQKMMDNAWERVGGQMTDNCYTILRRANPEASEQELRQTASEWARQLSDKQIYDFAVKKNTPKSTLEYFGRTVADMNILNSVSTALARSQAGTSGDLAAYEQAMGDFSKNHRFAQVSGTVVGMAIDPVTWVSGGVGSLAGKGALNLGGRFLASRAAGMSVQTGSRLFGSSLTGRIIVGSAGAAGNLATYEGLKEAENQFKHGGYINPETGENEGYSAGEILKSTGHGAVMGSVIGPLSPLVGNVADKAVKATSSTAGKFALRGGEVAVSTLAEGTIFSVPQWINGEGDAFDVWTDNMAMMLGFKAQHGIKSAPRIISSLRPVKPVDGKPLTQAERNHNRMDFEERLRRNLDASPSDMSFSADERDELRRAGYGELSDLFSKDRVPTQEPAMNPAEGAIELRAERVEAETIHNNPEFDGYSAMEELMQDSRVSQAARAKAYYVLTGRMLPMSTVTGYTSIKGEDGSVIINSTTADGEIVTSRKFANEKSAQQEIDNVMRQAELNSVDVGERYAEAIADDMVLSAAVNEVSPGADPETVKRIYRAVKAGNKDVTEEQVQLAEFIDDAIARNKDVADAHRPEAIREAIKEESGIDVDATLRKSPAKRTEAEQEAVKTYIERLFPEETRQRAEEPTPEQTEAQNQYEQGRALFGRYEEADPTAQADVDAIAMRMQEAYQGVEDAFGSEAEYYMFHLNENPWGLLNDPELTVEQQDAVLYYINSKAALDGVMDASNEVADRKRNEVQQAVEKRTHKDNGVIIPATMKVDDRQVYVVKGDIVMFPDGTGVDTRNSSESVVVMDAQSGEYEFTSPDQILKVSDAVEPQEELETAMSVIEQEQMSIFGENLTEEAPAAEEAGDNGAEIIPENGNIEGNNDAENIPADTEAYDRGYEQGIASTDYTDEELSNAIEASRSYLNEGNLDDFGRGRLEGLEYEQQRRALEAQSVPNNAESVPNPTENAVSEGENEPKAVSNEETPLSRIPMNEQGEPMFEAVDKDTAWDGLVEAVGTEADAVDIAMAQVQQATTDLEALKKKPPTPKAPKLKGSPMAMAQAKREAAEKYQSDLAEYNQQVADTQARLDAWNGIVGVYTSRNAELRRQQEEARRQRDAEAHDAAVAQFEEQQRIKAEKQAEQECVGVHAVNPKIKEKWDTANKIEGNPDAITLPDGSAIRGRYVLTEAGAASASHDVNNAYEPTEGFPIDENGQSVNDRDYLRDKDAQRIVEQMAGAYDNRALQTPVIVSQDGVVLSGNNRTMSGDLAARQGTDKAYVDYLREFGQKYGFTPEQVAGMNNPRLVFVPDEALPYDATTFSRFNAQEMKSQSKPEAAVKLGKIVPDNVFNNIVSDISRYDRLADYYADEKAVAHALGALMQAGVINDKQMPEMQTGTALSAAGKELIENTLIGKVFQTSPDAVHQIISMPTLRQSIVMGLNEIANNRTLSRNGYDLSEELSKAVDLITRAKAAMPDVYTEGMPVSPFGRQAGLFDDEYGDSRITDATTLLLADILNSGKHTELRKALACYNKEAAQSASGQMDMFSGTIPTKEEILTNIISIFKNGTAKEKQQLVDAAIAGRKERASGLQERGGSEAVEQTEYAGASSETSASGGRIARNARRLGREASGDLQEIATESSETDENGLPFIIAEDGTTSFGYINEESGLTPAPIKLSEGFQDETTGKGYGLVHIEAGHGEQIRAAGFKNVRDFVGFVAKNYDPDNIRVGKRRGNGSGTFLIQVTDKHDNTLFIELSKDGSYWNVNSGGIFRKGYSNKKETVAKTEPQQPNYAVSSDSSLPAGEQSGKSSAEPNGKSTVSNGKVNTLSSDKQGVEAESSLSELISAAEKDVNLSPTEAQKRAGNYKKGHVQVGSFDITIENPAGSTRKGVDANGKEWSTTMANAYGYIKGTESADGDPLDVFISSDIDGWNGRKVFVVDQFNPDGKFDEHKVMLGFNDKDEAFDAYLSNYETGWEKGRRLYITESNVEDFEKWIGSAKRKIKPFSEYKSVKAKDDNSRVGRSLSEQEATDLIVQMEANAEIAPTIELTPENWIAQFGEDDKVETPVGTVKMGENQFMKLFSRKRAEYFGMIRPTLTNPDVIIEKNAPAEGAERDSKYLFVKTFIKSDGSRFVHFESVTVQRDGMEVSISSHEAEAKDIKKDMQKEKILHISKKLSPGSEWSLTEAPGKSEGPDLVPSSDNDVSNGKVNTLSADKQTDGEESSEPYTITPTKYEGKRKTSDVWLVKFNRDLTAEEKAALDTFMRGKLTEGKKTSRGWYDRKQEGYMMRSEEAARQLGGMIGNEEAVADAQPLSREDIKQAAKPAEKPARKKSAPKPANTASVEDIVEKQEEKPGAPTEKPAPKGQFKVTDEMRAQEDELRKLLGIDDDEGDRDDYVYFRDPDEMTPVEKRKVFSLGVEYAFNFLDNGVTSFPDFARAIVGRFGAQVKPFIKSWYEGAKRVPGYGGEGYTDTAEVDRFDIENFDKPTYDAIKDAEMRVAERKAKKAAQQAHKELTEIRNNKRKKQDEQTSADTAALTSKAEAVARKAESLAENSEDTAELNRAGEEIDQTIEEINNQLALLGYYEAVEDDTKFHESYGYMLTAEKKAVADATKLAKQLVNDLGIDLKVTSATTPLGRKSVKKGTAVRANIAPAGGDVIINLPLNEGRQLAIYIGLEPVAEKGTRRRGDNLAVERIMYRVENPNGKGYDRYGSNNWANNDVTYAEFLRRIKYAARGFLPEEKAVPSKSETTEEAYHGTVTLKDGREAVVVVANHVQNSGEPSRVTDYIVGVKGEPGTIKISPDEIAHAGAPTHEDKPTIPAKSGQSFPDVKDTEAVSKWLDENSEAIWKGVDAIMVDARQDANLLNTYRADNPADVRELVIGEYIDKWIAERVVEMMNEHPATVKAWFDYGQRGLIADVVDERMAKVVADEAAKAKAEETHNGYRRGDEVMWDRNGNGKWEKQVIKDFDEYGNPILDSFGTNWISEVGDWERIKPADGIFGEAKRVATQSQADRKKSETPATSTPENPTEKIVEVMTGGKKPAKKKTAVKPEQPVADLFGGLFDEPISDEKKTDVQPRPGTAERERGHEPQPNEPLGESQRNEVKPTDGGGMVGRDNNNPQSNATRGAGVSEQPKKQVEPLPEAERKNVRNNHAERGVDYAPKGEDARIKANIEAIELAKRLLDAGETATPEQMEVLRKFSGWGGLGKAFNDNGYNPTTKRLRDLLGEDGYNEAVMSRNSAYFTPAPVIDAMWDVARALGFKGGNVLEGSAGIGNILGLMPTDISDRSNIHAVEIDRTTGGILSLLYPDAKVDIQGFERTKVRNNSVDLAITNVPFVTGLHVKDDTGDKDLSKKFRNIHDFCIAKNIRKLREGGLGIFITSSGTMDNSKELRRWITNEGNADVIGAFRMHNKTFGGTGATSDIIVVRKRVNGKPSPNAIDVADVTGVRVVDYDTGETRKVKGQEIPIIKPYSMTYNKYFAEHPENMAGEMLFNFERGETRFPTSRALFPSADKPQERMLSEWAVRFADMKEEAPSTSVEEEVTRINEKLGEGVKEGSMVLNSQGELCMARMGEAVPLGLNKNKVKGHTKAECFEDYTAIKKALSDVLEYQSTNEDNAGLEPLLKELNRAFDTFTKKYGNLHKNPAISFLRNDVDFSSIMALETYSERGDKKGNKVVKVGKTDIFSRRVIETEKEPQPTTIKDGILASLYKSGGIDVDYISQALGKSAEEVKQEIVKSGLGYENPSTGAMEVSYQYLSGNVRAKLHIAQENNEDGRYDANIAALEKVIPMTIPAHLIEFALGSSWIEPKLYEDFVYDKTGIRVKLTNVGGTWFMKTPWSTFNEKNRAMAVTSKMCDKTIMGHELIEAAITNRQITVSKQVKHYDGTTETISDKAATAECSTKIDEIRSEFKDWARGRMQTDPEMSARIEQTYNEQFNNYVPMSIPDEFVPQHFGGQVTELHGKPFALRPHQGRAVVRGTTEPILLAHEVGTGKTYTLITTAMEMRRLGTARKPMIVVQNATVGQFVESAKEIYPNAKVLTIEEADRTAEGRKNFYAKIKYNDWDMIVVPQSVFERIPDSPEREMAYIQDIIEEKMKVLEAMREADDDGRSMIVRQAEKELEEQRDRLAELTEAIEGKKKKRDEKKEATTRQNAEVRAMEMLDREVDDVENFDDMGIDAILVDEAHEYKHLGFATAMQRGVKGVDPSFSKKSQGVYLKTQAVMERNHGRNVVFATGTPISNTAAEIWTFMRYLMPADQMKAYDIFYFDDFVRNFGNLAQMVEFKTNGKFAEVSRFAGYVNLPELVRIWSGVADTVLTREAGGVSDKIPEMEGGKPTDIYLPQTRALRSVMKYVKAELDRYDKMTGKEKKENSHIPLTMYGIAKAAAVDARLVIPNAEDDPNSKTNATVRETLRSLKESANYKGTVAIFSDNYQNKRSGFNLYEEIRNKLIAEGIPAEQIVVIKSGMTVKKKLDIFDKVNAGEIRVILGSTFTLGTGVNIQERLHTLIHVDAPNRPMDYTQRNGRAMRQGNLHKDMGIPVRIIRFGVEDSLDVTAYQRLKTKGAIADSIMNGSKMMQNSMENRVLEEEEDTFGDMTAQLSGSEYAILKNQAEREVRNLTAKQKGHDIDQIYVHNQLPKVEGFIKGAERRIEIETKNLETIGKHWPDGTLRKITIGKLSFDSVEGMEDFFKDQNAKMNEAAEKIREGADNWTSRLTIDVDGLPFEVTTTVTREVDNSGQGTLSFEPERKVTYSCEALGIKDRTVKGNRIKNVMQEIAERIVTGAESRELLSRGQNQLAHYSEDYRQLQARNGKEFEHKQQLAEAKERLAKYEELMKKELEEKEAKYAEMDKAVDAATDITLDDDGEDVPTSGDGNKYRLVEQKELLDFLDGQPLKLGYRYSQWANMGVLPPMTAKQNGEWRAPMIFSRWEQSEEGMRKDNGKADLVQGNGRTTGDVAYNPYFHIRTSPLNDQFTAAYDRPELLVVEGYYPEGEEESGYRAEGAKDAVGLMDWHSGSVNGQLSDETKVQTMLSRYFKPSRIVPWSEVADLIMERVGDQRITFPINAVPPMLRAELAKRGAKFGDISGSVADADIPMLNDLRDRVNAGEWDAGLERAREYMDAYESSSEAKEARVEKLSADLHTPIRVISDQSEIDNLPTRRERRAKGWWSSDDNGVVVVLPNNVNVADVDNTVVHEVVGHKGLRALIGAERFDDFLGEVYNHASNPIRKTIDKMTDDMVNAEADRLRVRKSIAHERAGEDVNTNYYTDMAEARLEAEQKREQFRKEATEEYMSDLGGRIGSEGFEKMSRDELTLWGKIKAKVQQFLDKFLQGLKIAKSIRLNDKDLSYILYKSWKNLRKKGMFADAEDAVRRRQSGYDADDVTRFRDPGLGLEETITRMKTEAMQANAGNLQAKRDAMRAIGGNLNHLRQAMARQREYDITTVKSVSDLARVLMEAGLLDDLSKYETKRILGAINNVVGKQDVSQYVQKVMDIMVDNQLRLGANTLGRLLSIRGSRVDARGIEVQGELDPEGQRIAQVVRKSTSLPKDDIDNRIADALNRMGSADNAIADEATIEYAGLQIARQYVEDITESKAEEKELRDSIKQAKEDKDAGQMTEAAYKQYVEATNDAIRQNKIDRAEAFHSLVEQVGDVMSGSIERAKAWREAEKQRVEEIHHNANSDMEGRPTDEHHKDDRTQKIVNNSFARFLLAPLATFDQMLRMFGKKNTRGEGYLWNRYMRGWVEASEKEYTGYREALKVLDDKVSEVFGKKMSWGDLFSIDRKLPKASVSFWDGGEMKDHELTQGNLLYIYMADKMSDGRMKLRRMGVTEEDIENIKNFLDPRFIELADWMQDEFLVDKRNEYNEVHKRMFGASMAAIENYFPLKILANARLENVDVADDTTDNVLPATSTGSIIKRRRNNLALDVTGANAFSVILDHLQQMERWAAFAEFNRDLNTLLSYKRFRNQVMNMSSVYGAGKTLWNNFRNVCSMAAGAYRPPIATLDKSAVNIAKGVTAAKVSFRLFTALKQFLSMPAYLSDSNPAYLIANIANPIGAWKWSMENLPLFEKRWKSRMAGDPRLLKTDMDWKMWRSRVVEIASRVGMSPNAFVDALTVAIGTHAMYQTKLAKYKRMGYPEDIAEERAKQDATILFNQTQQSSESAFLSTMQVDRSWLSVLFTVFRNSSMSYTRQLYDSVRSLKRYITPGNKALSVEFMAKQMRRDGIDPDKADANAKREYRRNIIRDLARVAVFGFALQFAWNLGAYLPYFLLGDDDQTKAEFWDDVWSHSMFGSIEGLTGGDVMSAAGNMWLSGEGNPAYLTKDMPLASDVLTILKKMDKDQVSAMNDVINVCVQSGIGVNPQSLTDAVTAVIDFCGDDAETARECALLIARILNCPQSQLDKIYFDEIGATGIEASKMTPAQIAERYAEYKINRNAPLMRWAYSESESQSLKDKYIKNAMGIAKKNIEEYTDKSVFGESSNLKRLGWEAEYKKMQSREEEIGHLKSADPSRYAIERARFKTMPEYARYKIVKKYRSDINKLTKEWLRSETRAKRDTLTRDIIVTKNRLLHTLAEMQQ